MQGHDAGTVGGRIGRQVDAASVGDVPDEVVVVNDDSERQGHGHQLADETADDQTEHGRQRTTAARYPARPRLLGDVRPAGVAEAAAEAGQHADAAGRAAADRPTTAAAGEERDGDVLPARLRPVGARLAPARLSVRLDLRPAAVDGVRREDERHDDGRAGGGASHTPGYPGVRLVAVLDQPDHRQHGRPQTDGERQAPDGGQARVELVAAVETGLGPGRRVLAVLLEHVVLLLADRPLGSQRRVLVRVAVVVAEAVYAAANQRRHRPVPVLVLRHQGTRTLTVRYVSYHNDRIYLFIYLLYGLYTR